MRQVHWCIFPSASSPAYILTAYRAEHKITGSVLLKLDVDILERELGIVVYGTQVVEAVNELRQEGECKWLIAANATDFFISLDLPPRCSPHCHLLSCVGNTALIPIATSFVLLQ